MPIPNLVHQPPKENHGSIILPEIMIKGNIGRHPNLHNEIKSLLRGPAHNPIPISRRIAEIINVKVIHQFTHQGRSSLISASTASAQGETSPKLSQVAPPVRAISSKPLQSGHASQCQWVPSSRTITRPSPEHLLQPPIIFLSFLVYI